MAAKIAPFTVPSLPQQGADPIFLRNQLQKIGTTLRGVVQQVGRGPTTFASLPAASSALEGTMRPVTDSTTATWGATITGGGAHHVLAYCNGAAWTVAAA